MGTSGYHDAELLDDWEQRADPPSAAVTDRPIPFRALRAPPPVVVSVLLAVGTAAQIVRTYGESEVQVSSAIPHRRHRSVARHILAEHADECVTADCLAAQGWLNDAPLLKLVSSATA